MPDHQKLQTPYIPPRIWHYQITRLRECLDDFLAHRGQSRSASASVWLPIGTTLPVSKDNAGHNRSIRFSGRRMDQTESGLGGSTTVYFIDTAHRFGMVELFRRWLGVSDDEIRIQTLSRYLNLVSRSGLCYLLNFSLMRVEEAWNLRADCCT